MPLRTRPLGAALALVVLLTGCSVGGADGTRADGSPPAGGSAEGARGPSPAVVQREELPEVRREIPGLGPRTRAGIDPRTRQVFVVSGEGADANRGTAVLYERDRERGWQRATGPWHARNALKGWTKHHMLNDLRTPIGVFGLSDAGGLLPDPGTELPYDQRQEFTARGVNFEGESIAGVFDHVIAVDYNRKPGRTPLDWTRPLGASRGGGIWIHADHGGATKGCVALSKPRVAELLRRLDPDDRPVVVMGPEKELAR